MVLIQVFKRLKLVCTTKYINNISDKMEDKNHIIVISKLDFSEKIEKNLLHLFLIVPCF